MTLKMTAIWSSIATKTWNIILFNYWHLDQQELMQRHEFVGSHCITRNVFTEYLECLLLFQVGRHDRMSRDQRSVAENFNMASVQQESTVGFWVESFKYINMTSEFSGHFFYKHYQIITKPMQEIFFEQLTVASVCKLFYVLCKIW